MATIPFFPSGGRPALFRAWRCTSWIIGSLLVGSSFPAATATIDNPLMAGRGGDVNFPISCGEQIQPRFDAALAALHAFWYSEAQREFTAISQTDPDCAIAYWGIAITQWNQIWAPPRPDNLKAGGEAIHKAMTAAQRSPREADYINALATFYADSDKLDHRTRAVQYSKKMEALVQKYPEDHEAEIFYALSLLATADPLDKTYKNQLQAGAILEKLSTQMPTHPGIGHYIIHAYDYPALADRALAAALKYETCVTVVPHAIHMPSHTFVLLGRWQDTINVNIAAQEAERDRGIPEDRVHDLDYLVLAYLQLAQDKKAKETVDLAREIEDDMVGHNHNSGLRDRHYNLAALEARWALERHDWEAAAALPLRPSRYAYAEAIPHFARAVGLARLGHSDKAQDEVDRLVRLTTVLSDAKLPYWAAQVEIEEKIASGWIAKARGQDEEAVALMQAAAKQEDGLETHDTLNPGPIGMTADESLGMLLLELKRPADAFKAFEASLRVAKNRLASYAGAASAAAAVNDVENARKYYAKVIELAGGGEGDRPEVTEAKTYMERTSN
jgi:tetratricopeptide (TPR) repeat protein